MKALITGINGMDGRHMKQVLEQRGYDIFGSNRVNPGIKELYIDITEDRQVDIMIDSFQPDVIFHFAAVTKSGGCWDSIHQTIKTNGIGSSAIFESVKRANPKIKIINALSSEIYKGYPDGSYVDELSQPKPVSPYGYSKMVSYDLAKFYRDYHGLDISNVILFNHTSEYQKSTFVIPKIIKGVKEIVSKTKTHLTLGNIDGVRDIGYAGDFTDAIFKISQLETGDDFIINNQNKTSIRDIIKQIFAYYGIHNYENYIKIDEMLKQKNDVYITSTAPKLKHELGITLNRPIESILNKILNTRDD